VSEPFRRAIHEERGNPTGAGTAHPSLVDSVNLKMVDWKGLERDNIWLNLPVAGLMESKSVSGRAPGSRKGCCGHTYSTSDIAAPMPSRAPRQPASPLPEKVISLLPPPPSEAAHPLPPPPPSKVISLLPPPPRSEARTPAPQPPSGAEPSERPSAVTPLGPRIAMHDVVRPSLRPRVDRYAQERLRKTRGARAALMVLIALFLALSGTVGYLVAARQSSQTHLDSLMEIVAWEREQLTSGTWLEDGSAGATTGSIRVSDVETSEAPGQIDAISGSGSATTDVVSTRGPWRLEWTGEDVFVFVKRAENGHLVHADGGQGSGSFVIEEDGRFILDVLARGTWSLTVVR
jgi:hypothetical protein